MARFAREQRRVPNVRFASRRRRAVRLQQDRPIRPIMSLSCTTPVLDDLPAIAGRLGIAGIQTVEHHERRRRPRTRSSQSVKLYDPESGRYFAGHTCDVSDGGFRLEMPARLPALAGRTACVYIAYDGGARAFVQHTQMLPVRYVWVRRDTRSGTAICGVQILADTASAREAA